jgi:hypothetical protein
MKQNGKNCMFLEPNYSHQTLSEMEVEKKNLDKNVSKPSRVSWQIKSLGHENQWIAIDINNKQASAHSFIPRLSQ